MEFVHTKTYNVGDDKEEKDFSMFRPNNLNHQTCRNEQMTSCSFTMMPSLTLPYYWIRWVLQKLKDSIFS